MNREELFKIIEPKVDEQNKWSRAYDYFMIICILLSIAPLFVKSMPAWYDIIDNVILVIFIIDYILRFMTADFRFKSHGLQPFLLYPISKMAIVDLISILPWFLPVNHSLKLFRVIRMLRSFRVFKAFKYIRHQRGIQIIQNIFNRQRDAFLVCIWVALGYVLASAIVIFNVEPETFDNFFEAVYWAVVSLTTVGYGDIYPVSTTGRVIAMISAIFGIAVVALPSGIITAGFFDELKERKEEK